MRQVKDLHLRLTEYVFVVVPHIFVARLVVDSPRLTFPIQSKGIGLGLVVGYAVSNFPDLIEGNSSRACCWLCRV